MSYRIFLIWKADPNKGEYIPIGSLEFNSNIYKFQYVAGVKNALKAGYSLIPEFQDVEKIYLSEELFPLFSNRLMNRGRNSFVDYLDALALEQSDDQIHELARSGGRRATDRYKIISMPEQIRGSMKLIFFAVGLTRPPLAPAIEEILPTLEVGQRLLLSPQLQNIHDPNAIMLHTEENQHIGWIPQYYSAELKNLLVTDPNSMKASILRVNYPLKRYAPDILLIEVTAPWPRGWKPFQTGLFERIAQQPILAAKKIAAK